MDINGYKLNILLNIITESILCNPCKKVMIDID